MNFPYPVIPIVRHHHEQWDGRGYPDKLRGQQIPITARIISVVDCFDSVREDRPFRRGMTLDEATALLLRGAGIHFDPAVVEQFIKHLPRFDAQIKALGLQHQPIDHSSEPPIQLSDVHSFENTGSEPLEFLIVGVARDMSKHVDNTDVVAGGPGRNQGVDLGRAFVDLVQRGFQQLVLLGRRHVGEEAHLLLHGLEAFDGLTGLPGLREQREVDAAGRRVAVLDHGQHGERHGGPVPQGAAAPRCPATRSAVRGARAGEVVCWEPFTEAGQDHSVPPTICRSIPLSRRRIVRS